MAKKSKSKKTSQDKGVEFWAEGKGYRYKMWPVLRIPHVEEWCLGDDDGRAGSIFIIQEREHYYFVHASIVRDVDEKKFCDFVYEFLGTMQINEAYVTVHHGGKETDFSYEI